MKKRYLYSLLFGIPGFFVALIVSFVLFGVTAGFFWLYVFGDNPWPAWTQTVLPIVFVIVFLLAWIVFIGIGFMIGKRLESDPHVDKLHILLSGGLTLLFILLIALQQFSVGNLGPKSDGELCSDYCLHKGYAGSGMPPRDSGDRTCSCYDDFGNEVLKMPVDEIELESYGEPK